MWERIIVNKDFVIVAIAAFLIGFGAATFVSDTSQNDAITTLGDSKDDATEEFIGNEMVKDENGQDSVTSSEGGKNSVSRDWVVEVENQRAGGMVDVARVSLPEAGWLAVREGTSENLANILGAAWFPAGEHMGEDIILKRGTIGGETYHLVFYADTVADKIFDKDADMLLVDQNGKPYIASFSTVASPSGE